MNKLLIILNLLKKNYYEDCNLPRSVRWFIFIVFVIMNILMNIDHGTIPAATYKIITDLSINDQELGLFGSLVFVGNLIGALASLTLINLLNRV